jgi:hypothetical protein
MLASSQLFNAMGITTPSHGGYILVSELHQEMFGWMYEEMFSFEMPPVGLHHSAPDMSTASNPNNVFISALTDNTSFSSAMAFATQIQDGNFGNVIGEPSANAPASFGEIRPVYLPVSGLEIWTSTALFLRPDVNADQTTLWPDIMVPAEDALDVALEFLRNLDR